MTGWLSVVYVIISASVLQAQFTVDYSRIYGGSGIDAGHGVAVHPDQSRVLVGGRAFSSDFYLKDNNGGSDYWLMEMTPDGDTLWSRSYGGADNDDIHVVHYNGNGLPVAFGTTWSEGSGDVPVHTGNVGAWLVSTDPGGNVDLSRVYSGTLGEQGVDFQPLSDGGYALLVLSTSPEIDGQMNHGIFDFWVARVNAIGDIQWSRFFGGELEDRPARIIRVIGGLVVIGSTASSDGDITENAGGYDYWVMRLNLEGGMIWQKTYGGSGDDIARHGIELQDGTILITGESNSTDGDRFNAYGGKDVWMINIDLDGNLLWEKSYGGTDDDSGTRLARVGNTRIALLAQTESDDLDLTGNKGREDAWLAYLSPSGNILQQMNYGGSLDDFGNGLTADADSVVYMVGGTRSIDGNLPFPGYADEDLWLLRMSADTIPCEDNFECFRFDDVNFAVLEPESDGPVLCLNGCNGGADQGPFGPPGCTNFIGPAAWFKVKTDADAEVMSLQVETPEFNHPQVLVLQGVNCANFTAVNCDFGSDGEVTIINMPVEPDTFYYVVVGDRDGLTGSFDLCVNLLDVDFCNRNPLLYVNQTSMGSPLQGPFLPGEEVQICYEVTLWDKLECNGLQGILPTFGPGWDSASFNSMGRPVQIDTLLEPVSANGEWDWWPLGNVHYNFTNPVFGYSGGQQMPTGWYFVNYDDAPPNDNPDQSIGDLDDCENDDSRWKVCFTLQTVEDCAENLDCSVTVKSFADGEIGANVSQACQNDPPLKINRFINCCIDPRMDPIADVTICSGDTVIILLESTLNPPVTYAWGVNVSGSITGASSGVSNNLIFNVLTNNSNTPGTVTYIVQGQTQTCQTPFEEFTVTVMPQPSGNMTLTGPSEFCRADGARVRFDFIGDPPFIAEYAIDGEVQPPVLSETQSTTITIPVDDDAVISFIGFVDRHNCEGDPNGAFNVSVLQPGESFIDTSICQGDSVQIGDHMIGFPGMYVFTLENAASNGCDSIITLDLEVNREYERSIFRHICEGEVVIVGPNAYGEPGFYSDTLETVHGCDSIINLTLQVSNEIIDESNAVICAGSSIEFGGELLFQDGTYYDTVTLSSTCDSIYILNLNVLDVIVLIQTVIEPDTGENSGSILIQVAGGIPPYNYLWNTGDTTNAVDSLGSGAYHLTVTDLVGCSADFNFFIVSPTEDLLPGFEEVRLFPNPSQQGREVTLQVRRDRQSVQPMLLRVADPRGVIRDEMRITLRSREELIGVNPERLVPGMYFVLLEDLTDGGFIIRRFVIQ